MSTLDEKKCVSCKILARCFVKSCKIMHYSCKVLARSCKGCLNLARSCKVCFNLASFFQDFNISYKILARIALSSQCFFYPTKHIRYFSNFSSTNLKKESSSRFRTNRFALVPKTPRMILSKNSSMFLISDAFKHV